VKRFFSMMVLLAVTAAAFALPSVEAVQAEVKQGHYAQAESMMREVLAARPGSAKAHYVLAEILAHDRHFAEALQQARRAQQIAPDLGFTQPQEFRSFERLLETELGAANPAPAGLARLVSPLPVQQLAGHGNGVPGWAWALGGAMAAALLWSLLRPRPRAVAMPPTPAATGFAPPAPGYGTGYSPAPSATSGMLGAGLAAAGGLAAGMLVEKMLDSRGAAGIPGGAALGTGAGLMPGPSGDELERNLAADELEQRPIDFGSGADWGGGDTSSDGW